MPDNYDEFENVKDPVERAYNKVILPESKPKNGWDVNERRAYILDLYTHSLNMKDINKKQLSEDFDVSRQTIYNDLKIIRAWHKKHKGYDFEEEANKTFKWGLRKAKEKEDLKEAREYIKDFGDWLHEEGERDKEPEELKVVGGSLDIEHGELDVEDDNSE